jgi:hypothetical protein
LSFKVINTQKLAAIARAMVALGKSLPTMQESNAR